MIKNFPHLLRRPGAQAMTLVEVMMALSIFAITILGTMTVLIFSMRTVDDSRSFTQATQILNHEMESMHMRAWGNRTLVVDLSGNTRTLHGIGTLGSLTLSQGTAFLGGKVTGALAGDSPLTNAVSESYTTFPPFAVYGKQVATTDNQALAAVISGSNSYDVPFSGSVLKAQYRNASGTAAGFTCTRRVTLLKDGCGANYAVVTLTVSWNDLRNRSHSRSMTSTMSENGLNSVIYDLSQVQ